MVIVSLYAGTVVPTPIEPSELTIKAVPSGFASSSTTKAFPEPTWVILTASVDVSLETTNCFRFPTEVREEIVTPVPRVVELKTGTSPIWYDFPAPTFKFSLDFNDFESFCHSKVFWIDVEPIPIPAPSNKASSTKETAIPIVLELVCIVACVSVVVDPSTIRFPTILTVPEDKPTLYGLI